MFLWVAVQAGQLLPPLHHISIIVYLNIVQTKQKLYSWKQICFCSHAEMWATRGRKSTQDDVNHREHFQLYKRSESIREKIGHCDLTLNCVCECKGESSVVRVTNELTLCFPFHRFQGEDHSASFHLFDLWHNRRHWITLMENYNFIHNTNRQIYY